MKISVVLPLILFLALGWALYIAMYRDNPNELPSVFLDKPAPELPLTTLDGYSGVEPAALTGPGLKLVNFWASWCAPCRAEHPTLVRLAGEGWTIIGINKSDEPENARAFLGELGNPYTMIATDEKGRGSIEWGVYGIPETFLVDADGKIRLRHAGPVTSRIWEQRFEPIIAALAEMDAVPSDGQSSD